MTGTYPAFVRQEFKETGNTPVLVEAMEQIVVKKIKGLYEGAAFAGSGMSIRLFFHGYTGKEFLRILDQDFIFFQPEQRNLSHKKSHVKQRCAPYGDEQNFNKTKPVHFHGLQKYDNFSIMGALGDGERPFLAYFDASWPINI